MSWGQRKIIGLDIDDATCVATSLAKKTKGFALSYHAVSSDPEELAGNSFIKAQAAVISLPAQAILFRSFPLSPSFLKSKNLERDLLNFLTRQNLPFKLEQCYWDKFLTGTLLSFVAARNEIVERYIKQAEDLGLNVLAVVPSFAALKNVLILNFKEKENLKFGIFNIKDSSAELLICEAKKLFPYPLSMGKKDLQDTPEALEKFTQEIQRVFNAHSMQNASSAPAVLSALYLSGQACPEIFLSALKNVFTNFEVLAFDPFNNIGSSAGIVSDKQLFALSLGLGITYAGFPSSLNINLIKNRIKKEKAEGQRGILKRGLWLLLIIAAIFLTFLDARLLISLRLNSDIYRETILQVSSLLPQAKALTQQEGQLEAMNNFLEDKLNKQLLHSKALVVIAENKPQSVLIKELDAETKQHGLKFFLSGTTSAYDNINDFVTGLRKDKNLKEVKVVTSTFPSPDKQGDIIDFKLRFEIE